MAINYTLLFDRIRSVWDLMAAWETAQNALITNLDACLAEWEASLLSSDEYGDLRAFVSAVRSASGNTQVASAGASLVGAEIGRHVKTEVPSFSGSVSTAIDRLIAFMEADAESVAANTTGITVTTEAAPAPRLVGSIVESLGVTSQRVLPETVNFLVSGNVLTAQSPATVNANSPEWPGGSAARQSLVVNASPGLISNGGWDDSSVVESGFPDDWEIATGTVGTSISQTVPATKTITVSGSPTTGWYAVNVTDLDGNIQQTAPLAYNASGSQLQVAINALVGFSGVTVSSSGTTPNFTHTITFTGVAGTPASLTIKNETNGTITPADGASVDTGGLSKLAMKWVGGAAPELTTIRQRINLAAATVYAFGIRLKKGTSATGVVRIRLVDGAHSVVADDAGTNNTVSVDVSTLSDSAYGWTTAFFRSPSVLPTIVKLEISLTTTLGNTHVLYFDQSVMVAASQIANQGVWAALFAGTRNLLSDDVYSLVMTNNFAGTMQTRFGRHFNKQLPTSGSPTIAD